MFAGWPPLALGWWWRLLDVICSRLSEKCLYRVNMQEVYSQHFHQCTQTLPSALYTRTHSTLSLFGLDGKSVDPFVSHRHQRHLARRLRNFFVLENKESKHFVWWLAGELPEQWEPVWCGLESVSLLLTQSYRQHLATSVTTDTSAGVQ